MPTQLHERAGSDDRDVLFTAEEYVRSAYLTYTYASTSDEPPGCALVDTAAQHGLIGAETLTKLDNHLQRTYKLRVQYTQEEGGTVRGVCGSEQVTRIAYIPIALGGKAGVLRVQVVPCTVPCLLPAYLLTQIGASLEWTCRGLHL